jgi:CarD family transcriptional regulator
MFQVGDLIIYGNTGVCKVTDVTTIDSQGIDLTQLYYVLKPLYQNGRILTPTNNTQVFMRPIIPKDEAERLIDMIPSIHAKAYHSRDLKQLSEHYGAILNTHDCGKLIELGMSLYEKKQDAEQHKRKFLSVDERFMTQAEELLFGELSAALGIPKDKVPEYIASRVDGAN